MRKKSSLIVIISISLAVVVSLSGCSGLGALDVVGKESISSFEKILNTIPNEVAKDETNVGWSLTAPDDSVRFIWSEDYSKAPLHDVMLEFDAQPFLDSGLDPSKLPENYVFYEGDAMGGMGGKMLMVGTNLGDDVLTYNGAPTALSAYEQIVNRYRDNINYHTTLDHYGVKLGDGNMFEWAKDMDTNSYDNGIQDKDTVFVLNPEPLIAAGVDPTKADGWVYAQVPIEEDGKTTDVWKFLKPFDLQ
jgi:hypothetical protein